MTDTTVCTADSLATAGVAPQFVADVPFPAAAPPSVVDAQAAAADTCPVAWTERIVGSFVDYAASLDFISMVKMAGLSLLVLLVLFALYRLTRYFFRKVDRRIIEHRGTWFKGVRVRGFDLLSSAQLVRSALIISKTLRYTAYALLLYTALPLIFVIFPATRSLAGTLFSWIATPVLSMLQGFVAYLPKLLRIAIIIVIMRYILKFLRYITQEIETGRLVIPKFYPDWARATFNLLRIFIYAFTLVLIFPLLPESESAVFKGVSVFIGVLFSIGSSSVISNMVAGMVITYMRSFKVGDRIRVGEVYGDVIEKTLFVIRVETVKREIITVPNSTILASNVVNYSIEAHEKGVILYQDISVGYDVGWQRASDLLIVAAKKTEHVLRDPVPFVLTKTLGDNAAVHQINVYTKRPELQAVILSELNRHILDVFLKEGIEMVVPMYEVSLSDNKK